MYLVLKSHIPLLLDRPDIQIKIYLAFQLNKSTAFKSVVLQVNNNKNYTTIQNMQCQY